MSFFQPAKPIYIRGPYGVVPDRIVDNQALIDWMGAKIRPSWIEKRTGIQTRHWVAEAESTSDLAFKACEKLFTENPNLKEKVRGIQLATISGDYPTPPSSPLLQDRLGLKDVGATDLGAACAGFVTGLHYSGAMAHATSETQLLIAADVRSKFLDAEDFGTAVLFGDGAAACIISTEKDNSDYQLVASQLFTDGSIADMISIPVGGSKSPVSDKTDWKETRLRMKKGAELFMRASEGMASAALSFLQKLSVPLEKISWVVPHQANLLLIQETARRLNVDMSIVTQTVTKYGNTSGSSTGLGLSDLRLQGTLKSGDLVLMIAAGGGGLAACCLLKKT